METRRLRILYNKNGQGRMSTKITLPLPWLREMGVTETDREVTVSYDGERIVIEKAATGS